MKILLDPNGNQDSVVLASKDLVFDELEVFLFYFFNYYFLIIF